MVLELKPAKNVKSIKPPPGPIPQSKIARRGPALRKRFEAVSLHEQELMELELRAAPVEVAATNLERIVYHELKRRHIPFDFRSSQSGGRPGYMFGRQVADFALWQHRIVLEIQGAYWHSPAEQQGRDAAREMVLKAEGWTVLYLEERIVRNKLLLARWLEDHVIYAGLSNTGYQVASLGGY